MNSDNPMIHLLKQKRFPKQKMDVYVNIKGKQNPAMIKPAVAANEKIIALDETENPEINPENDTNEENTYIYKPAASVYPKIVDKRTNMDLDRKMILNRLKENVDIFPVNKGDILNTDNTIMSKIPIIEEPIFDKDLSIQPKPLPELSQPISNPPIEVEIPKPIENENTQIIKIKKKVLVRRTKKDENKQENKEEKPGQENKPENKEEKGEKKAVEKGQENKEEKGEEEEKAAATKRKTKKIYDNYYVAPDKLLDKTIKINKKPLIDRLPKKEKLMVRTSNYYMTNRKKYVQEIAKLFTPYQDKLKNADISDISCDGSKGTNIELFMHQQVVREYLNVMTPYRGLLLYHGLGSGKTCTSIAIAEGMKTEKQIVLMTPASLKMNYFSELKKCGDLLFRKNQFWEFISTEGNPAIIPVLSQVLQIDINRIEQNRGVWLVDVTKPESNFDKLTTDQQKSLDEQLNLMIRAKYLDINYNGITANKLKELTQNFTINPFDNKTIIIDEAHNFVSRIVNKLNAKASTSYILYDYLLKASNAKIILLTGTPIVNYPNEIGVLFNILRGYIKTWTFQLVLNPNAPAGIKLNTEEIAKWFQRAKINIYDFLDFNANKLTITRNPFGFANHKAMRARKPGKDTATGPAQEQRGGGQKKTTLKLTGLKKHTVGSISNAADTRRRSIKKQTPTDEMKFQKQIEDGVFEKTKDGIIKENKPFLKKMKKIEDEIKDEILPKFDMHRDGGIVGGSPYIDTQYDGVYLDETGNISDDEFIKLVRDVLAKNHVDIKESGTNVELYKALPDDRDTFLETFIDQDKRVVRNLNTLHKRILGLTSYFRSANEKLLPRYELSETGEKYHIVNCPMNAYQFAYYQDVRKSEAVEEKNAKANATRNKNKTAAADGLFAISSSYRMFSRAACNFAFPDPPGRPFPDENKKFTNIETDEQEEPGINANDAEIVIEEQNAADMPETNATYEKRIEAAMRQIRFDPTKPEEEQYLSPNNLPKYSQKMSEIIKNVIDPANQGLHLLYSNFLTIEGIGILRLILEANGFAEFRLKKNVSTSQWEIDDIENLDNKPRFVLYTGKQTVEEKEIIRNIYNGNWEFVPSSITAKLREISPNNIYGEIIKMIMITASGSEGINLKNTRFVHITEPYWNMSRIEQVIGRARRICSHQDLPEELRTVKVFFYISTFSKEQMDNQNIELMKRDKSRINPQRSITTDENLYEIALLKTRINDEILLAVKQSSIDCSIYNTSAAPGTKEEKLVCYNFGNITSNDFGAHPSLEEDIRLDKTDYMNVRKEKLVFKMIPLPPREPMYAMKDFILYTLDSYREAMEDQENGLDGMRKLVRVGEMKLVKIDGKDKYKLVLDNPPDVQMPPPPPETPLFTNAAQPKTVKSNQAKETEKKPKKDKTENAEKPEKPEKDKTEKPKKDKPEKPKKDKTENADELNPK
jgi:hypothetical protein